MVTNDKNCLIFTTCAIIFSFLSFRHKELFNEKVIRKNKNIERLRDINKLLQRQQN